MHTGIHCVLLTLALLCGCAHRQYVREPYPRWGEEIRLDRADRPEPLIVRVMRPVQATSPPACLLIVHGMNEYVGRYRDVARHFAKRFIVAGFDLYAHGLSNPALAAADRALAAGSPAQEVSDAYLAQVPLHDLEPMRQDLDQALRQLIALCDAGPGTGTPVFVLAHSLGALVASSYLLQGKTEQGDPRVRVRGIVLLGPAFSVTRVPGWRGWLANPFIDLSFFAETQFRRPGDDPLPLKMAKQAVALPTALVLDGLFEALSWPGLRALSTPITPDWVVSYLTDWEDERARHRADGWIIRRSLLRYVKGIEREIVRFRGGMGDFATPYFLVYSIHDPITPAWGNHDFALATQHKHPHNELLRLDEAYHHEHLFAAPRSREDLLARIDRWLDLRLASLNRRSAPP